MESDFTNQLQIANNHCSLETMRAYRSYVRNNTSSLPMVIGYIF
jgi:hypothetical protein